MSTPKGAAGVIAALLKTHAALDLPVRLRAWDGSEASLPAITEILSAEQVRVWRLYLAGGALAFEQGRMGVDQILAARPRR